MGDIKSVSEMGFRPVYGPVKPGLPPVPLKPDAYEPFDASLDGRITYEREIEIAQKIDTIVDPFFESTMYSVRRLYKLYEQFPDIRQVHEEMSLLYENVSQDDVERSFDIRSQVLELLLPYAQRWADWCITYNSFDLTPEEIHSIAQLTTLKIVTFTSVSTDQESRGMQYLKHMAASIKPMVHHIANLRERHSLREYGLPAISGQGEFDEERGWDGVTYKKMQREGTSVRALEDAVFDSIMGDAEEDWQEFGLRDVTAEESTSATRLLREKIRNYSITEILAAVSLRPLFQQSRMLFGMGYIGEQLSAQDFSRNMGMQYSTKTLSANDMQVLIGQIESGTLPVRFSFAQMRESASNAQLVQRSYIHDQQQYFLFELLAALGDPKKIDMLQVDQQIRDILHCCVDNIIYTKSGAITPNLTNILSALQEFLGRRVDNKYFVSVIHDTLIPAIRGEHITPLKPVREEPEITSFFVVMRLIYSGRVASLRLTPLQENVLQVIREDKEMKYEEIAKRVGVNSRVRVGQLIDSVAYQYAKLQLMSPPKGVKKKDVNAALQRSSNESYLSHQRRVIRYAYSLGLLE